MFGDNICPMEMNKEAARLSGVQNFIPELPDG